MPQGQQRRDAALRSQAAQGADASHQPREGAGRRSAVGGDFLGRGARHPRAEAAFDPRTRPEPARGRRLQHALVALGQRVRARVRHRQLREEPVQRDGPYVRQRRAHGRRDDPQLDEHASGSGVRRVRDDRRRGDRRGVPERGGLRPHPGRCARTRETAPRRGRSAAEPRGRDGRRMGADTPGHRLRDAARDDARAAARTRHLRCGLPARAHERRVPDRRRRLPAARCRERQAAGLGRCSAVHARVRRSRARRGTARAARPLHDSGRGRPAGLPAAVRPSAAVHAGMGRGDQQRGGRDDPAPGTRTGAGRTHRRDDRDRRQDLSVPAGVGVGLPRAEHAHQRAAHLVGDGA